MKREDFLAEFHCPPYLHFDRRFRASESRHAIDDPKWVAKHKFLPFIREIKVKKKRKKAENGQWEFVCKERPIAYPGHVDALVYAYYFKLILDKYERTLAENPRMSQAVLAFRSFKPSKDHIQHAKEAFELIKNRNECVVFTFDVRSFFDSLDHKTLKAALKKLLRSDELPEDYYNVFRSLTQYKCVDKTELTQTLDTIANDDPDASANKKRKIYCTPQKLKFLAEVGKITIHKNTFKGIAQGASISTVLSNVYMMDFDEKMLSAVGKSGIYRRYCDDILLVVPKNRARSVQQAVKNELAKICLEINDSKSERFYCKKNEDGVSIAKITENPPKRRKSDIQYLGFLFDGKDIRLRDSTLARLQRKMKKSVEKAVYALRQRILKALEEELANEKLERMKFVVRVKSATVTIPYHEYRLFRRGLLRRFVVAHPKAKSKFSSESAGPSPDAASKTAPTLPSKKKRKFNFADYVKKATKIMNPYDPNLPPKIKKQFRNAAKILDQKLNQELASHGIIVAPKPKKS